MCVEVWVFEVYVLEHVWWSVYVERVCVRVYTWSVCVGVCVARGYCWCNVFV